MKIAHLDTGRSWRGGQAQVLLLMRGLRMRGHACLLLAPRGPLLERAAAEGMEARAWRPRFEWDAVAMLAAARALRRAGPDIVHCHSAHAHAVGVPAARLAGVPGVVVSRRVDFAIAGHWPSRIKYRLPVDRYLCISRGVMEVMRAGGVPEARLALVPSGVELPAAGAGVAAAADLHALIGAPREAPIVGTVAALAPHKNHADLARAATIVLRARPDARFVWVGEGPCRPALERQIRESGLGQRVHVLGFRDDARGLLAQFSLFALASYLEGMCTSLLDAQALGIPIVATAVGGIPDIVEEGRTGRLVPPRDPAALASAVLDALADAPGAARRAAAAQAAVRDFSADAMVVRTLQAYDSVLRGRRGDP